MEKHEKHCTANPKRSCRMCVSANGSNGHDLQDLLAALENDVAEYKCGSGELCGVKHLREAAEYCPACMLAAIRKKMQLFIPFDFDYEEEKRALWKDASATDEG